MQSILSSPQVENSKKAAHEHALVCGSDGSLGQPAPLLDTNQISAEKLPADPISEGVLSSVDASDGSPEEVKPTCGRYFKVVCTHCGHVREAYKGCGDRFFCAWCRKVFVNRLVKRFGAVIDDLKRMAWDGRLRILTLTVRSGFDLNERLDHLFSCFRKLKQRKIWKKFFKAGIRCLEVTWKDETGWHPHFHVIFVGNFIRQQELRDAWESITKDSCVVDIRLAYGGSAELAKEFFKYTVKDRKKDKEGNLVPLVPMERRSEVREALKGRRIIQTLGEVYRKERALPKPSCEQCGSVGTFVPQDLPLSSYAVDCVEYPTGPPSAEVGLVLRQGELF